MASLSADRSAADQAACDLASVRAAALHSPPPRRVDCSGFLLIAELKPASPSEGALSPGSGRVDLAAQAACYARAGAGLISVLTEPSVFGGSLESLASVSALSAAPTMRKDFLIDPYQVYQARAAGASAILIVVRMLDDLRADLIIEACAQCGLFVVLEAFDAPDIDRCVAITARHDLTAAAGGVAIGVNTRDLATLRVDSSRLASLSPLLPSDVARIAESGLQTAEDVRAAVAMGYTGALVGTALMRAANPEALAAAMVTAGRESLPTLRQVAPRQEAMRREGAGA